MDSSSVEPKNLKPLPPDEETEPDANGIKTVITYKYNEKNEIVKVTKKVQIKTESVKMFKSVAERKDKWVPFGLPLIQGNEGVVSSSAEEVRMTHHNQEQKKEPEKKTTASLKCQICGGPHLTKNCPVAHLTESIHTSEPNYSTSIKNTTEKSDVYITPAMRNKNKDNTNPDDEEDPTISITNLYPEATEQELRELCRNVLGYERPRIRIITDTNGVSKGLAFITFDSMETAKKAVQELDHYALGYMIMNVSLATKRKKRTDDRRRPAYMSGYGKALPQNTGRR